VNETRRKAHLVVVSALDDVVLDRAGFDGVNQVQDDSTSRDDRVAETADLARLARRRPLHAGTHTTPKCFTKVVRIRSRRGNHQGKMR